MPSPFVFCDGFDLISCALPRPLEIRHQRQLDGVRRLDRAFQPRLASFEFHDVPRDSGLVVDTANASPRLVRFSIGIGGVALRGSEE